MAAANVYTINSLPGKTGQQAPQPGMHMPQLSDRGVFLLYLLDVIISLCTLLEVSQLKHSPSPAHQSLHSTTPAAAAPAGNNQHGV
jgi:hypothetical protein